MLVTFSTFVSLRFLGNFCLLDVPRILLLLVLRDLRKGHVRDVEDALGLQGSGESPRPPHSTPLLR